MNISLYVTQIVSAISSLLQIFALGYIVWWLITKLSVRLNISNSTIELAIVTKENLTPVSEDDTKSIDKSHLPDVTYPLSIDITPKQFTGDIYTVNFFCESCETNLIQIVGVTQIDPLIPKNLPGNNITDVAIPYTSCADLDLLSRVSIHCPSCDYQLATLCAAIFRFAKDEFGFHDYNEFVTLKVIPITPEFFDLFSSDNRIKVQWLLSGHGSPTPPMEWPTLPDEDA